LYLHSIAATFYDQWFCNPKDDTQYRSISGDTDGACYTFGKDMPGTACEKFTNGGVNKGACDGEAFVPEAVLVQPGTACEVFADDNCEVIGRRMVTPIVECTTPELVSVSRLSSRSIV
jgi:hypothetical protein